MSVDTNIHIGPYMKIKGEIKEEVEKNVLTCSNTKCSNYKENVPLQLKFCGKCSFPSKTKTYKIIENLTAIDFVNDYDENPDDDLCYTDGMCGESNIFISNKKAPFDRIIDVDEATEHELMDVKQLEEIDWFLKKHKKIIKKIQDNFGEDSVEVTWGLVVWFS